MRKLFFALACLAVLSFLCCPLYAAANADKQSSATARVEDKQPESKPGDAKNAEKSKTAGEKNNSPAAPGASSENNEKKDDSPVPEEAAPAPVNEAWEVVWSGQRDLIKEMRDTARKLGDSFGKQTHTLSEELQPFEEEGRRLLVFTNTFRGHPNAMEAVNRRIGVILQELNYVLQPVTESRKEAESLLQRVNQMAENLPDDVEKSRFSPEMRSYIDDLTKTRFRLMAVLAQYDSILPSMSLIHKLEETRKEISGQLPALWKDYYMQKPVPWLSPAIWENTLQDVYYSWQAMLLRLPVEIPVTLPQWLNAVMRFFIGLVFAGVLTLILKRRWLHRSSNAATKHILKVSIPWLILGFAFMGSALSATGDIFRVFLAIGSMSIILGQVLLAWDLRLLQYPDEPFRKAPFLSLVPLAFCAYAILYLPLTRPLALVIWVTLLILALLKPDKNRISGTTHMQVESGALDCYPIILWICLFIGLSGFHIYSITLYLAYVALALALEASLGGMSLVSNINEHLPQEGARAVLARLLVAVAAPLVVVVAVIGFCLWVAMLPGGTYLLEGYALKGVSIGATQFNIFQVLLIFSVFYLTRTVVSMGTRFLAKLPQQGVHFDATLITPLQTALTYTAWAFFGLFVLRSLGMELSNLAMVMGGLSVGIGFGMQTIVNNFLSGLILIFGRTLQVGDVVDVGGTTGRVRKISVRATMVETYDNAMIYVPNSEFMSQRLINWTSFSRSVRKEVQVGVAYGSDTALVIQLLISIAKAHENVLKYPVPAVNFADFAASSLDFRLRFWVKDYDLGASTASDIRLAIDRVFAEKNIEIAFPQLDVHLKDMPRTARPPMPDIMRKSMPMQSIMKPAAANGKTLKPRQGRLARAKAARREQIEPQTS